MEYVQVNRLAEVDLAGCLAIVSNENNYLCLREHITMRLALYRSAAIANCILDQVVGDGEFAGIDTHEYVINELQYEYRLARGGDGRNETRLINEWVKKILLDYDLDRALDFVSRLKGNRERRVRAP
jgi:hypothetical protein